MKSTVQTFQLCTRLLEAAIAREDDLVNDAVRYLLVSVQVLRAPYQRDVISPEAIATLERAVLLVSSRRTTEEIVPALLALAGASTEADGRSPDENPPAGRQST